MRTLSYCIFFWLVVLSLSQFRHFNFLLLAYRRRISIISVKLLVCLGIFSDIRFFHSTAAPLGGSHTCKCPFFSWKWLFYGEVAIYNHFENDIFLLGDYRFGKGVIHNHFFCDFSLFRPFPKNESDYYFFYSMMRNHCTMWNMSILTNKVITISRIINP